MKPLTHVIPMIDEAIENIKDGLLIARPEAVPALQAEARAFLRLREWLADDAPDDRSLIPDIEY